MIDCFLQYNKLSWGGIDDTGIEEPFPAFFIINLVDYLVNHKVELRRVLFLLVVVAEEVEGGEFVWKHLFIYLLL